MVCVNGVLNLICLKKIRLSYYALFVSAAVLYSCKEDDPEPVNEVLIGSENILTRTAGELQTFISLSGLTLPVAELKYDVDIYKITYKTEYLNDEEITASGLVILPKKSGSYPMVSFQHGTIAAHTEAPSVQPVSSTELILYAALASPGFIAAVPDYIGFGSSANLPHPYYVEDLTAEAVTDMLDAAFELAREKGITFNKKLFLAGYSQGGYATMAAHKEIESDDLDDFDLVASFPASGGYDVKGMQEYFFSLDTYEEPFYIGYVASSYKTTYNWSQPFSDIFNEPYATRIPSLYDGSKSSGEINAQLTTHIPDLLNSDILANIDTDARYKNIIDAFNENSLTDWKPTRKMYMYHGDADVTVPYSNSTATYNKLISNGASASIVTLTSFPGKNHETGVGPYIEAFVPLMLSLR